MPRHPPRAFFRIIFFSSGSALVLLHEQLESTLFGASSHSRLIAWYFITAVISICRMASVDPRVCARGRLLELRRLELLTSSLQSWRSTS